MSILYEKNRFNFKTFYFWWLFRWYAIENKDNIKRLDSESSIKLYQLEKMNKEFDLLNRLNPFKSFVYIVSNKNQF